MGDIVDKQGKQLKIGDKVCYGYNKYTKGVGIGLIERIDEGGFIFVRGDTRGLSRRCGVLLVKLED